MIKNKYVRMVPAPLIVILVAIPLGHYFDLAHEHKYLFQNHSYTLSDKYLVTLPSNLRDAIQFPDFAGLGAQMGTAIKYIVMFALVGTLESLLTAKAIDMLDPWKRKTNLNRDILGAGIGNTLCGLLGGLPMISEVVRSSANTNNGAKTKWSNFFHGLFLLAFVVLLPNLIHQIPLAALAAMLVYTGFRLASPKDFYKTYKIGIEQLAIFLTTIVVTLFTDLLVGIGSGILLKFIIHFYNGLPLRSIFKPIINISTDDDEHFLVDVGHSAVFSNYIVLKKHLEALPRKKQIVVDFSEARLVDNTVMEGLHNYATSYESEGGSFKLTGLEHHTKLSSHPRAAHKKRK